MTLQTCPKCENGTLKIREGKYGPFKGCTNYPDCGYISKLSDVEKESYKSASEVGLNEQKQASVGKPVKNGTTAMYVSYVKDLVVAGKTTVEAVAIVKKAIKEFS